MSHRLPSIPLTVPFEVPPYPDEIIGSWLARLALHNGQGVWMILIEAAGYNRRTESLLFDVSDYSDKFEKLLNMLGTSYERAMRELTTLPYWLAFDAASTSAGMLPGTMAIPKQVSYRGKVMRSVCSLGIGRSDEKLLHPRCCPRCLERDFLVYGEPYWHRSHQLPNVFFCHEHHCPLQTSCPVCSRTIVTIANKLIDPPRLQCSCGHDFRIVPGFDPPSDAFLQLTQFSVQALNCSQPQWNYEQIRIHIRSLLDASDHGRYDVLLADAFKVTRDAGSRLCAEVPGCASSKLWLRGYFSMAAASECCAILVALGLDFDKFALGFVQAECTNQIVNSTQVRISAHTWTIKSARQEILRRVETYPNRPPSAHKALYWFLQIHDGRWLTREFPILLDRPMPSVDEDRQKIKQIFSNSKISASIRHRTIKCISAGMRAYIRDQPWLLKLLNRLQNEQKGITYATHINILEQRASAINSALQKLLIADGMPTRIIVSKLAAMAGLTHNQASITIRAHPELRDAITAANNDKVRRQLLWAARQLLARNLPLSVNRICKLAGLTRNAKASALIIDIIDDLVL